ncbi:MAG: TRAP transporter substrate-binding protein DctP [Pseudomonadota bacterium]
MKHLTRVVVLLSGLLLANAGHTTTFKIATSAPDGSSWMEAMRDGAETISERSDGRVKFRFYPGGIMGNDKSVLRKLRVGQLHGGALTGGGLADIVPEAQIYSLPFLFRDHAEVDHVRATIDPLLLERLEKNGYVSFGISEGGFAYLMSSEPISASDDLQGNKVWVPEGDAISRSAFEATGVSPVSLPLTDVLTGLQTGLIDTVAATPVGAIALQWHTRVKHLTNTPLMYIHGALVLKRRTFERLNPADQTLVREVMGEVFERLNHQTREDNREALEALRGQGIGFVESSPEEIAQWRQVVGKAMQRLIREGLFDSALYDQVQELLKNYRSEAARS